MPDTTVTAYAELGLAAMTKFRKERLTWWRLRAAASTPVQRVFVYDATIFLFHPQFDFGFHPNVWFWGWTDEYKYFYIYKFGVF